MPDVLNGDGNLSDIKITTRYGEEVEYSKSSVSNSINSLVSMSSGKSFASLTMAQQHTIFAAIQIPTPYMTTQMDVVQSRVGIVRADNEPTYRYTVSADYPYSVSVKDNGKGDSLIRTDYYIQRDRQHVTIMDAEKDSLMLLINYHKRQLHKFKVDASKYSRKKKNKTFAGYHQPNDNKYQRVKKMAVNAVIKLENIEDEHPEWMI